MRASFRRMRGRLARAGGRCPRLGEPPKLCAVQAPDRRGPVAADQLPRRRGLPGPPTVRILEVPRSDTPVCRHAFGKSRNGPGAPDVAPFPQIRRGSLPPRSIHIHRKRSRAPSQAPSDLSPLELRTFFGSAPGFGKASRAATRAPLVAWHRATPRIDSLAPSDTVPRTRPQRICLGSTGARPRPPHRWARVQLHPTRVGRVFQSGS
jgi:hypothetical protein